MGGYVREGLCIISPLPILRRMQAKQFRHRQLVDLIFVARRNLVLDLLESFDALLVVSEQFHLKEI